MIDRKTAPFAALLLRISLGILFIAHGLLKWLVFTLPGAAGFFQSLGLPGWLAYATTFAELAGGIALVLGFHARFAAQALSGRAPRAHAPFGANAKALRQKGA